MTNEIKVFENEEFGTIRIVEIDGEPWFVAKDVSDILGYAQTSNMMKRIDDEDSISSILDGMNMKSNLINESGDNKSPVNKDALYDRMRSISKIFCEVRGEQCNIFMHTMRHSRAECLKQGTDLRLLDENGVPIVYPLDQIMKFMHHSDISTTQSYLMNHDEEEIDAMFGI